MPLLAHTQETRTDRHITDHWSQNVQSFTRKKTCTRFCLFFFLFFSPSVRQLASTHKAAFPSVRQLASTHKAALNTAVLTCVLTVHAKFCGVCPQFTVGHSLISRIHSRSHSDRGRRRSHSIVTRSHAHTHTHTQKWVLILWLGADTKLFRPAKKRGTVTVCVLHSLDFPASTHWNMFIVFLRHKSKLTRESMMFYIFFNRTKGDKQLF